MISVSLGEDVTANIAAKDHKAGKTEGMEKNIAVSYVVSTGESEERTLIEHEDLEIPSPTAACRSTQIFLFYDLQISQTNTDCRNADIC